MGIVEHKNERRLLAFTCDDVFDEKFGVPSLPVLQEVITSAVTVILYHEDALVSTQTPENSSLTEDSAGQCGQRNPVACQKGRKLLVRTFCRVKSMVSLQRMTPSTNGCNRSS